MKRVLPTDDQRRVLGVSGHAPPGYHYQHRVMKFAVMKFARQSLCIFTARCRRAFSCCPEVLIQLTGFSRSHRNVAVMADEELLAAAVPGICRDPQTPSILIRMVHPFLPVAPTSCLSMIGLD
jgi:hypothetical protein